MVTLKLLAAGVVAGLLANVTGYVVTGRLFHRFQAETPATWRATESWTHYQYATAVRIGACIAIAVLYGALANVSPSFAGDPISRGMSFGSILWAVTILPVVIEVALFVNWHRGFVVGLLLDWLVVCVLASVSAAVALRAASPPVGPTGAACRGAGMRSAAACLVLLLDPNRPEPAGGLV